MDERGKREWEELGNWGLWHIYTASAAAAFKVTSSRVNSVRDATMYKIDN